MWTWLGPLLQSRQTIIGGTLVGHMELWEVTVPDLSYPQTHSAIRDPEEHRYLKSFSPENFFRFARRTRGVNVIENLITFAV